MDLGYSLNGRVAIVTGAARGIGRAIVERFLAADAATVIAADVLETDLHEWTAAHERVVPVLLDVADEAGWQDLVADTVSRYGGVDILANNAGIFIMGLLEDMAAADFRRLLDVNVMGVFLGLRAVTPVMKRARRGVIVNTSSVSGISPNNSTGGYAATKFAVRGLTRSAALELGPFGVRVNSIHPGGVNTPMGNPLGVPRETYDQGQTFVPMQRSARPREIAAGVHFLASDAGSYCNGTELVIDGGMQTGHYLSMLPGSPL